MRIDTAANTAGEPVAADEGISFFDIDAGDEGTWLVGSSPEMATTLYAVDPTTGELTDQKVQMVIDSIASGEGAVWLGGTIFPDGAVGVPGIGKFDPSSGELTTTALPGEAGSIAVGSGAVWAVAGLGEDGTKLYRIDPATGELTADDPARRGRERLREGLDGAGAVWVNTAGGAATRSTLPTTRWPARPTRWGRSASSSRRQGHCSACRDQPGRRFLQDTQVIVGDEVAHPAVGAALHPFGRDREVALDVAGPSPQPRAARVAAGSARRADRGPRLR